MNKNTILGTIILLGLLISGGLIFYFPTENVYWNTPSIWTAEYGRFECKKSDVPVYDNNWVDEEKSYTCGSNFLIDNCKVELRCGTTNWLQPACDGAYRVDGGSWIPYYLVENQNKLITTINSGEKIEFATKLIIFNTVYTKIPTNEDLTEIRYIYNPYRLYTVESGARVLSNSNNCNLADQTELNRINVLYGEWDNLDKGTDRNYFYAWTEKQGLAVYEYNNEDVICSLQTLYNLDSKRLADGSTRLIQRSAIKNVECCPHQDNNCNEDFEWSTIPGTRTCTYDYQCNNGGMIEGINDELATQEKCVSGVCTETTIDIECNSDQKCISKYGNGYFCDLRQINFGKCVLGSGGSYCGDDNCDTGETFDSCPKDCADPGLICKDWETQGFKTVYKYNVLGVKVGAEQIPTCVMAGWVIAVLIFGSLLGLALIGTLVYLIIKVVGNKK